jgi:ABC-type nitrate/sulfonate/bicarbonate transport system substrate-binding protein
VAFIGGLLNKMIFSIHVRSDIKSAEDLKGKLWGSDRPGTPNEFATQVGLNKLKLERTDLQVLPIGSSDQVLAALLSGQLSAAPLTPPASFAAEAAGYPMLIDLYDFPYQNIGMAGRRSQFASLEPSLVPFLKGLRSGVERYNSDKAYAIATIAKYTNQTNQDILEKSYEFFRARGFQQSLEMTDEGLKSIIDFLALTVPEAKSARPEQFYDLRYQQQLPKI